MTRLGRVSMYIVFEGIDGAGKMTLAATLCDRLTKCYYTGIQLSEPTYGKYGLEIRGQMARNEDRPREAQHELFTLDRREHVEKKIKPLLSFIEDNPSFVLVQDRYYLSAPAYQATSEAEMRARLKEQQAFAPKPDIVFLIDIPVEIAAQRMAERGKAATLFESAEALQEVRERYLFLASEGSERIEIIDGTKSAETLCDGIIERLDLEHLTA